MVYVRGDNPQIITQGQSYVELGSVADDPEEGDPDGGIEPGTAFEDIPDDWCCPICGVTKDMFVPEDE